ncbi:MULTISPECIES: hypothetical protein [Chelativorans]|uniref:hypothetical protein n=1 Tax=Chelativorans TaxID=449972 RepID=UPI0013570789|nr:MULTISPECIES: hypothetical protein [Chelativorans]
MKHSMEQAIEIRKAFEAQFGPSEGVTGVGICLSPNADDLALNVYVSRDEEAVKLPRTFDGLDVVVEVVGTIRKF